MMSKVYVNECIRYTHLKNVSWHVKSLQYKQTTVLGILLEIKITFSS